MPKNLVVLIDGTGNEIEVDETNVLRLARLLINDVREQIFYYDPGVGTQGATGDGFYEPPGANQVIGPGYWNRPLR